MKLRSVTKLDKRNKRTSKNLTMMSCQQIVTPLPFFQYTANLEQLGSRNPYSESVKVIFSLTVTFYITKTESRTKKSLTQLSHYCFK